MTEMSALTIYCLNTDAETIEPKTCLHFRWTIVKDMFSPEPMWHQPIDTSVGHTTSSA